MNRNKVKHLGIALLAGMLPFSWGVSAQQTATAIPATETTIMKHTLPKLPYAKNALAPAMSEETIEYHYGKHLQTYLDNLNSMIVGTPFEDMDLEQIVIESTGSLYNNAAQAWNHTLFFLTMTPEPVAIPDNLEAKLTESFGSVEAFKSEFLKAASTLFGAGWAWLAEDKEGKLLILQESNAGNPLSKGLKPLLGVDVWEHSYYIDYRNRRADYLEAWWKLVDWSKVAERL